MARRRIEISRSAERQLKRLPAAAQTRVIDAIATLADDPFPQGSRKLSGYGDVYRVRVGRYRVLYSVARSMLIVIVLKIGHRQDVYR